MDYRVVAFDPVSRRATGSDDAASELGRIINSNVAAGWEYVGVETISAVMPGTAGCFGIGADPSSNTFYGMVIFRR